MDSGGTETQCLDTQKDEALGLNIQTEMSNDCGRHYKQLVTAVHAVMLESGFVGIDPVSKTAFTKSLSYTLPHIIDFRRVDAVVLKFQTLGRFCNVYGCLANGKGAHWATLDEDQFSPFLNFAAVEVSVKDKLALPLLIDLCVKCGLNLPLCFMSLPTEIKLKVLESLPGVEIANVACVCSELRNLASSDYLWKQKFVEQFGDDVARGGENWKEKFAKSWDSRKRRKIYGPFVSYMPSVHFCRIQQRWIWAMTPQFFYKI